MSFAGYVIDLNRRLVENRAKLRSSHEKVRERAHSITVSNHAEFNSKTHVNGVPDKILDELKQEKELRLHKVEKTIWMFYAVFLLFALTNTIFIFL